MESIVRKSQFVDKHIFRSRKVHGCCFCRDEIPIGSSCHTEIVFYALKSFRVRYYHAACWRIQRIKYGHRWCDECERQATATATAEDDQGLLHLRRSESAAKRAERVAIAERTEQAANDDANLRSGAEHSGNDKSVVDRAACVPGIGLSLHRLVRVAKFISLFRWIRKSTRGI